MIITKVGIPSFVVTLAGLLAWNGVVLLLIGSRGTVMLQNDFVIGFANDFVAQGRLGAVGGRRRRSTPPSSSCGCATGAGRAGQRPAADRRAADRRAVRRRWRSSSRVVNQDRGLPYVAVLVGVLLVFWTYVLRRTRFGRHVYAVGGNAEAARRAGINVDRIKIACFAICSLMAVVGGIVLASRLRSVDIVEDSTRLELLGGVGGFLRYRISEENAAPYEQTDSTPRAKALVRKA